MKIAVIGAGWYGAYIALELKKNGHEVVLFEKNPDIFSNISGNFGIRLHAGPHYPRSPKTRESCRRGLTEFQEKFPDLVVHHAYSIYALGTIDANGEPSKVNQETFQSVCEESESCQKIDVNEYGYSNLIMAMNIEEPSITIGSRLRETFKRYLKNANINVICNFEIKKLEQVNDKIGIHVDQNQELFDHVVNATSYQALLPNQKFPFDIEVVYQPCLALVYKDKKSTNRPFSFIATEGWFPCLMPYGDAIKEGEKFYRNYILTHGKWTIMASAKTANEAEKILAEINDEFIIKHIKPSCEQEMKRFWPEFANRFEYVGWKGNVLAKIKTNTEFRSAVTFGTGNITHIIPGKVSNIFDAGREVLSLIENENIINNGQYRYVENGVLHQSMQEITKKPDPKIPNTCNLQTYKELKTKSSLAKPKIVLEEQSQYSPTFFAQPPVDKTNKIMVHLPHQHFSLRPPCATL